MIHWKTRDQEIYPESFPIYTSISGISGYISFTHDKKFIFFSILHDDTCSMIEWKDVTNQFEIKGHGLFL